MFAKKLWNVLTKKIVKEKSVIQNHYFPKNEDVTSAMPIENRYPGLKGSRLVVSTVTPKSERLNPIELKRLKLGYWMQRNLPLTKYLKPLTNITSSYPKEYEKIQAAPWEPEALDPERTLVEIAIKGPFSHLTSKRDDGKWELDVSALEKFETKDSFLNCGGKLLLNEEESIFSVDSIEAFGNKVTPQDKNFELIKKRFISGLCSYSTLIDHLVRCHLATCGAYAIATTETLSAKHPLRIIMHPTIVETFTVNDYQIDGLILNDHSNVPSYTGYPLEALNQMIKIYSNNFDISMMDPVVFSKRNGSYNHNSFVTVDSSIKIWEMMFGYYLALSELYFKEIDIETRIWVETIDKYVPNGIKDYLGINSFDELTTSHIAKIITLNAYTSSVKHFIVGTMTRNYFMFPKTFPSVIPNNGSAIPEGIVRLRTNSATIAGISRFKLIDETSPIPSDKGKDIQKDFFKKLRDYSTEIESGINKRYLIDPNELMSSIHA